MLKKFLIYVLFIAICFMVPSIFYDYTETNNQINMADKSDSNEKIDVSGDEHKIKLLLTDSNEIIELALDDYIKGVVLR